MILILSNKWDVTVDFVVRELRNRGAEFLRINTEDLLADGMDVRYPGPSVRIGKAGSLREVSRNLAAVWNRRPGKPFDFVPMADRPSDAVQKFVSDQWFACLEALELVEGVRWINPPAANERMESKPRQLQLAAQLGFATPRTLVSNRGDAIRAFCVSEGGQLVAKALYAPLIEEPEQDFFVFSNIVDLSNLTDDQALAAAPSIFQQVLSPKVDYRVTVVGDRVLGARLAAEEVAGGPLDWRTGGRDLRFEACRLPATIEDLCRAFVSRAGLAFGAIDLVEHADRFYFLEINPNGEWGWLEKTAGIPISSALCDLLTAKASR